MRDLAVELVRLGHQPTVIVPEHALTGPFKLEHLDDVRVLRLRAPQTRGGISLTRRAMAETIMPLAMAWSLLRSPIWREHWDGVAWYSPSIFLAPFVRLLKTRCSGGAYLILRDIFPDWAVDAGVLPRRAPYLYFRLAAAFQYAIADIIGVQSPGNLARMQRWANAGRRVEVLHNWLSPAPAAPCSIDVSATRLAGRRVFVYAGNVGRAQGIEIVLDLAALWRNRIDVGFLIVGRGSEWDRLGGEALARGLDNVLFAGELPSVEIPALLAQCDVGLVILHPHHRSHNVPGKLLAYLRAGLPVLARVNPGNDVIEILEGDRVGRATTDDDVTGLARAGDAILDLLSADDLTQSRSRALAERLFSSERAARQIVDSVAG